MRPGKDNTRPTRIVFLAPRFGFDHVRVTHKEALTFLDLGCEVTLICRNPPGGRYLGISTVAALGAGTRVRTLLSAPLLALQALRLGGDLYVAVNPFALPAGLLLAAAGQCVVYSTHEDFQQKALIRPHVPRRLRRVIGHAVVLVEQLLSIFARATVVTQPDIQSRYARAFVIENAPRVFGPIVDEAKRLYHDLEPAREPTLVYAGAMSRDRGLFAMLELVARLNAGRPWRLVLVGALSPDDLAVGAAHPGWRFVEHLGTVSHARSLAEIRRATFGLGLLADVGGYAWTSMTKLYEYMLMETPFVVSGFARWRESVRGVQAGLFVDPHDIASIATQIEQIHADPARYRAMQAAGRRYIEREFSWEIAARPLHRLLTDAVPGREVPSEA